MNIRQIKKLIHFLGQSTISELDVSDGICSIRMRQSAPCADVIFAGVSAPLLPAASVAAEADVTQVTSPSVGMFYRQSDEASSPYVEIGRRVKKGDMLGVIKMMRVSNPVLSATDGIIASILVENGQPVEYEQPLFTIG